MKKIETKRVILTFFCAILFSPLTADELPSKWQLGLQFSSDTFTGIQLFSDIVDLSLKAQAIQIDGEAAAIPVLIFGGHAAYVFNPYPGPVSLSLGAEIHTGLGTDEPDYAEYIDAGPRFSVNYHPEKHILISGVCSPFWISTRELEDFDNWGMIVTLPKASVAVTYLF